MQHKKSFFSSKIRKKKGSEKGGRYKLKANKTKIRGKRGRKLIMTNFKTKLTNKTSFYFYAVIVLGVIMALIYFIFLTPTFRTTSINLYEGEVESENLGYKQVAARFRGKNLLLLRKRTIIDKFLEVNPRLKNVEIEKDYPHALKIIVSESPLAANLIVKNGAVEKKFIINELGVVVRIDEFSDKLPTLHMENDHFPTANEEYLQLDLLDRLLVTANYFNEVLNIKVNQVNYLPIPKEVHLITDRDIAIWLDLNKDTKKQIDKLKDAIPKINIYEENFEYIDLRIFGATSDKIIYKRR